MSKFLKGIGTSLVAVAGAAMIVETVIFALAVKELLSVDFTYNFSED